VFFPFCFAPFSRSSLFLKWILHKLNAQPYKLFSILFSGLIVHKVQMNVFFRYESLITVFEKWLLQY
jgi:hypothetical protein